MAAFLQGKNLHDDPCYDDLDDADDRRLAPPAYRQNLMLEQGVLEATLEVLKRMETNVSVIIERVAVLTSTHTRVRRQISKNREGSSWVRDAKLANLPGPSFHRL